MGTVQVGDVPLPMQAPVHPLKTCFFAGLAVNVTLAPTVKDAAQCLPQLIPLGLLVTVPLPVVDRSSVYCWVVSTNVAVTVELAFSVKLQLPNVPAHGSLQPVNTLPAAGVA